MNKDNTLYCGFCDKSEHDVRKLIVGTKAIICNECVGLCATIMVSDTSAGRFGALYLSKEPPLDHKAAIKEIVRELREEAQGQS